jgi:hypothetical protein
MQLGDVALELVGMPVSHGRVFQRVANEEKAVIASRAVGKWATGLLLESYATKGFHNKAKSCPWGPMAGFVMADPRFTKNPDIEGQRRDLVKAVKSGGSEAPLYITDERKKALEGALGRIVKIGGNINETLYKATSQTGNDMHFVLRRTMNAPGANGKILWAVLYGPSERRLSNDLVSPNKMSANGDLLPVMAMVDPDCPPDVKLTYRAATTGDYDLWAVFPKRESYSRTGADKRMVPGSDRFKQPLKDFIANEDEHKGNLTPRIRRISEEINKGVRNIGYRGGDVVHHSDEAGRPMINDIDFPCIAFVPGDPWPHALETVHDLKLFIAGLKSQYVLGLNPGWQGQLGITVSAGGSYTV